MLTPEGEKRIGSITSNRASMPFSNRGEYRVLDIHDTNCPDIEGPIASVTVDYHPTPTITLTGGGEICQGESVDLTFEMTGTGPWEVEFSNDKVDHSFVSKENIHTYTVATTVYERGYQEKSGIYKVVSLADANCRGNINKSTARVVIHPLPTARIHGGGELCEGEENLRIALTGTPPWSLSISRNSSSDKIVLENIAEEEIEVPGGPDRFYIDYIQDSFCKYKRESAPLSFLGTN